MLGLTLEKLVVVGVLAAAVLGPERLPRFAAALARVVRQVRTLTDGAKGRIREELGPDFDDVSWRELDPRRYDPRRIVREALAESSPVQGRAGPAPGVAAAGPPSEKRDEEAPHEEP